MTPRLNYAILSMDAYNRGYLPAIKGLEAFGNQIGGATLRTDVLLPAGSLESGFFAQAYTLANGKTVISYRGTNTDNASPLQNDKDYGWPLGGGTIGVLPWTDSGQSQAILAIKFYRAVAGEANSPYAANITTTGHSLGGGLAGFVATIYGKQSAVYDSMAYIDGAESLRRNAIQQRDAGDPLGFKVGAYGNYAIRNLDSSKVASFETFGQALGFLQGFSDVQFGLNGGAADSILDVGPFNRHSQALLVNLIYADDNKATIGTSWGDAASSLWKAYFDETVASKLPGITDKTGVGYTAGSTMQSAIAYSAIKSGVRPFGDTAIDAMFNDASDLGQVLAATGTGHIVEDQADNIAKVFVQYAGGLALSGQLKASDSSVVNGVLKLAADRSTLAIDFGDTLWSKITSTDIVGKQAIVDGVLDQSTAYGFVRDQLAEGMIVAFGDEEFKTIDRLLLPTTDGQVIATLEKRVGAGQQTLFVSGAYDDTITGSAGNEVIHGGSGNDRIFGVGGSDLLYGGAGDDQLSGGSGKDFLFGGDDNDVLVGNGEADYLDGGFGIDVVKGNEGNDKIVATLDDEDDEYDGGTGTDTIVYKFEAGSPVTIALTATTNAARSSIADFGIEITGLEQSWGNDRLIAIEKAEVQAGVEDDTLWIALNELHPVSWTPR
jgi:Ca2+-binding RTX toxin-like protein